MGQLCSKLVGTTLVKYMNMGKSFLVIDSQFNQANKTTCKLYTIGITICIGLRLDWTTTYNVQCIAMFWRQIHEFMQIKEGFNTCTCNFEVELMIMVKWHKQLSIACSMEK